MGGGGGKAAGGLKGRRGMRDRQRVQRCTLRGLPVSPSPGRLPPKCDAGGDSRRCDLMSHPEGRGRALPDNARPPCFRGVRGFPTLGMLAHGGIKVSGMRDRPGACNGTGRPGRGPGSSAAVRTHPPVGRDLCNHVPVSSHAGWPKTSTCRMIILQIDYCIIIVCAILGPRKVPSHSARGPEASGRARWQCALVGARPPGPLHRARTR